VEVKLEIGDAFRVTPGTVHQMEAVTDCDILEVSTPHLDDVVRLKDRYGREGTSAP
jgi:quercetin dioxygenase-like cupin family protein